MSFPMIRPRRLRSSGTMRRLVRETAVQVDDLVYPLFVKQGSGLKEPISTMTGCFHFSPDTIVDEARQVVELGIPAVLLFGLTHEKDPQGSQAWNDQGPVQQAIRGIKAACPELLVMTDVCLCAYTDHGHCGVLNGQTIENDVSCDLLAKMALSHAQAGADVVAPSDMMDGRVGVIRKSLEAHGLPDVAIMSYAAKYASAFYGPFRGAAESSPSFGDRKAYQMDPANSDQAMLEVALDLEEGADMVMVKPALAYLDIIYKLKQEFKVPMAAYNVSGEYMMIQAAVEAGLMDRRESVMEMLTAMKRAGTDILITYFAKEVATWLRS
ncbi:MAG: porphobilinogen synthase [Phycisphaerae bacterium]|nr:porphobilinogen synthase [Phycisphaerae bacterium]